MTSCRLSFRALCLGATLLAGTACSKAQDCGAIDRLVATTYRFRPAALDSAHRVDKSRAMDAFWDTVRANPTLTLPCLRAALDRNVDDPFFRFDGAALLVSLDSSRRSKEIQLAAAEHVDLRDVALADWLHLVAARGVEGFNTAAAASRWLTLSDSEAAYYPPQHGAQRISKAEGALFLFGSMPESLATPYLSKVVSDTSYPQRELALWLLVQQATPAARAVLKTASVASLSPDAQRGVAQYLEAQKPAPDTRTTTLAREEFLAAFRALHASDTRPFAALVARVPDGEKDAAIVLRAEDLPEVRFARRYFVSAGTPEAIGYYTDFTGILEAVMARSSSE